MRTFQNSNEHLTVAESRIPLGSQTFSKSRTQYPVGISPLFATRAKGPHIWDVDGNKYIDLVNALASVTMGYGDSRLLRDIRKQLKRGVSLTLPTKLESEVSELINFLVPSAEMVRFSKNGSDATSAAIRLARSYTGRDHILACGYHGWQDWYVGSTTRNSGVPEDVSKLTHSFKYNDIDSLKSKLAMLENKVAAVILEPMNQEYPKDRFLDLVKQFTHKAGAVLIFDEVITGFRYSKGGAQEVFGVIPDLSAFGKGIANGFPLSAVVGKKDIMMEMEKVFLSGTFGGELLSLAAARNVLTRHINEDICGDLLDKGTLLSQLTTSAIQENKLSNVVTLSGHPTWRFINWRATDSFTAQEIRTYFMQEVFQEGILVLNTHNISQAHSEKIINKISEAYHRVFNKLENAINSDSLRDKLRATPLVPLFSVR